MFNEIQKQEYIAEQNSENTRKQLKGLFNRTAAYEEELDLDICEMSREQLACLLGFFAGTKNASITSRKSLLAKYIDWCIANKYTSLSLNLIRDIKNEEVDVSGKIRQQYVESKSRLIQMLDTVYPLSDTTNRYKRLMILLSFVGMEADEICELKKADVDVNAGIIQSPLYEDVIYQVDEAIIDLCDYCIGETEREWPDGRKKRVADNSYVIRPLAGRKNVAESDPIRYQMAAEIVRDFSREYNEITGAQTSITIDKIRESGEFLRLLKAADKKEFLGDSLDMEIAMRGEPSSRHNMLLKKNEFRKAYLAWARAFGYDAADLPEITTGFSDEDTLTETQTSENEDVFGQILDAFVNERITETSNSEQYERNIQLIRQMKAAYEYRCQLCDQYFDIDMEDGRKYVEVHHIIPNKEGYDEEGKSLDHPGNLIVVCPNHHRYLHYNRGGGYRLKKEGGTIALTNGKDTLRIVQDLHLYRFWSGFEK